MTFYISQWQGVGSREDPFQTLAAAQATVEGAQWSNWDLRPADDTNGYAVVWTSFPLSTVPTGAWLVAAGPDDTLGTQVRSRIASLLGVSALPSSITFRQAVRRLATADALGRANGRWNAIIPTSGTFQMVLGDLLDSWNA